MLLLIDNYDSFVHNLARYIGQLGLPRIVTRNDEIDLEQIDQLNPSHIILSPGPCSPNEAGICMSVIRHFAGKIPMLGVCLGHQAIAQAFGGVITKAKKPMHGMNADIKHNNQGILVGLQNPLTVGRYHSLIVSQDKLPECIQATAFSAEGEIMALQHKQFPIFGVQFHPESVLTTQGKELLSNFIKT